MPSLKRPTDAAADATAATAPETGLKTIQDPRAGWLRRLIERNIRCFPCPACQRDIRFEGSQAGEPIACPHCTATITAPDPDRGLPACVSDPNLLQVQRFQRANAHPLVHLKRGALESSVLRKQQRESVDAAPESSPSSDGRDDPLFPPGNAFTSAEPQSGDPAPSETRPAALPFPARATEPGLPAPWSPAGELHDPAIHSESDSSAPEGSEHRKFKLRPPPRGAHRFLPLDSVSILGEGGEIPLEWEQISAPGVPAKSRRIPPAVIAAAVACGLAVIALLGFFVTQEIRKSTVRARDAAAAEERRRLREADFHRIQAEEQQQQQPVIEFARKALSADSWQELLPFVRHPNRASRFMSHYYGANDWSPVAFGDAFEGKFFDVYGHRFFAFQAIHLVTGDQMTVGLEETGEGWKLDWEVLSRYPEFEWSEFLRERPSEPRAVRINAIRRTPLPDILSLFDVPKENAFGVMFWQKDISKASLYTVLDKDSELARQLQEYLLFDGGKKLIAELSFRQVPRGRRQDLVELHGTLTKGWTYLDDAPPAAAARP